MSELKRTIKIWENVDHRLSMKKCSNCFQVKSATEYYRKKERLQSRCKACNAEVVAAYSKRAKQKKIQERWDTLLEKKASNGKV